jgi:glutamate 5-kinase
VIQGYNTVSLAGGQSDSSGLSLSTSALVYRMNSQRGSTAAGTYFVDADGQWMDASGRLVLDAGAVQKLSAEGKSLLPIGVTEVGGEFGRGDVVTCVDASGRPIARGITNYASAEVRRILRKPSSEIAAVLGYVEEEELIHRDNLVLL